MPSTRSASKASISSTNSPRKRSKMHNYRVGTVRYRSTIKAEKENRFLMNSTELLIPKLSFQRIVREIMQNICPTFLIQGHALEALQEASETKVVQDLEDAYMISNNARRVTLLPRDMACMQRVKREP